MCLISAFLVCAGNGRVCAVFGEENFGIKGRSAIWRVRSLSKGCYLKGSGKEKSYEKNPSGVSLVLNQKFFRPFARSEKLAQAAENVFSTA